MLVSMVSCSKSLDNMSAAELLSSGEKNLLEFNYENAVTDFEKLVEIDQMNPRGYTGLAEAYNGLRNTSSAIDTLKRGLNLFNDDDVQKIEFLKLLTEQDNANPDWYLNLAQAYKSKEDIQQAYDVLNNGISVQAMSEAGKSKLQDLLDELLPEMIDKMSADELLNLGEEYILKGNYDTAVLYLKKFIEIDPMNSKGYSDLAKAYIGLGDNPSAMDMGILKQGIDTFKNDNVQKIDFLKLLIGIDKSNPEWYLDLAKAYRSNNDAESAIELLKSNISIFENDKAKSIEYFKSLIDLDPTNPDWFLNLAKSYESSGNIQSAEDVLKQGIAILDMSEANNSKLQNYLDELSMKQLSKMPSSELLNKGEEYLSQFNYGQAELCFQELINVESMNPRAYTGLSESYIGLGNISSAIDILKYGLNVFNNYSAQKIEFLNLLIGIDSTNPDWYLNLAQIYRSSGDNKSAINVLNNGIAAQGMSEDGRRELQDLHDSLSPPLKTDNTVSNTESNNTIQETKTENTIPNAEVNNVVPNAEINTTAED